MIPLPMVNLSRFVLKGEGVKGVHLRSYLIIHFHSHLHPPSLDQRMSLLCGHRKDSRSGMFSIRHFA